MQHLLLKAATTASDQGVFEAVISAASVDREKDVVSPDGMVRALQKWTSTGKKIPLAWNHSTRPEDIVGYIDPASAKAVNGEVVASGWIDQSTENGQHAWRLAKSGTLGFSFGYLIPDGGSTKRAGGGRNINELDVYEVTATPTPMNNDTRVLSVKSIEELRRATNALERELEQEGLPDVPRPDDEPGPLDAVRDAIKTLQEFVAPEPVEQVTPPDPSKQDRKAKRVARQSAREQDDQRIPDLPEAPRPRAAKQVTSDTFSQLQALGQDRYGQGDLESHWVYVDDFDPDQKVVVFNVTDDAGQRFLQVPFSVGADGQLALGDDEVQVVRSTTYTEKDAAKALAAIDPAKQRRKATEHAATFEREQNDARVPDDVPTVGPPPPQPPPAPEPPETKAQRERANRVAAEAERERNDRQLPDVPAAPPELATLHITHEEMAGHAAGNLKAVWSASYVNDLPDSAFLYIESGGDHDTDGKTTPRSLRHFPYKDASGAVDLPHLRNALARIPQSDLPQSIQESLTAKAQRILDAQKSVAAEMAPGGRRDPLRDRANAVELEFASGGESLRRPPKVKVARDPEPQLSLVELKQRTRDETLRALAGVDEL